MTTFLYAPLLQPLQIGKLTIPNPVSYTHLDVYKRQVLYGGAADFHGVCTPFTVPRSCAPGGAGGL